jgi:hypothetical protein
MRRTESALLSVNNFTQRHYFRPRLNLPGHTFFSQLALFDRIKFCALVSQSAVLKAHSKPDFYYRQARHPKTCCLLIKRVDHPDRKDIMINHPVRNTFITSSLRWLMISTHRKRPKMGNIKKHSDFLLMEHTAVSIFETRSKMVVCRVNDFYEET